jgi:hypothetical protein
MEYGVLRVPFQAQAGGCAPATLGQLRIWKSISWIGAGAHYFNVRRGFSLPAGLDVARIADSLSWLVQRHESLRSRWFLDGGQLTQEVMPSGEFTVAIIDATDEDPTSAANRVLAQRAAEAIPGSDGMYIWFLIVMSHGEPAYLGAVASHQAVDAWSMRVVGAEILADLTRGDEPRPPEPWQPRQQSAYEQSPPGQGRNAAALRYWKRTLQEIPLRMFPESRDGGDPDRVIRLELDSPALAVAAPRAADRFSTSVSSVLLAAEAALVGHITGHAVCAMQLIAVNRLEPRAEGMVGSVTGNALFSVELAGADFAELAARTHRRAMVAYRHGQCDTYALDDIEADVAAQRGAKFDLGVFFNDARARDRVPEPAADEAAAALSRRGLITQTGSWPRQDATFFMTASDGPASMKLSIMADTEVSPRPVIEAALRGIEELIVRAAAADVDIAVLADEAGLPRGAASGTTR